MTKLCSWVVVVHALKPSTAEIEEGGSLSVRPDLQDNTAVTQKKTVSKTAPCSATSIVWHRKSLF